MGTLILGVGRRADQRYLAIMVRERSTANSPARCSSAISGFIRLSTRPAALVAGEAATACPGS